MEWIGMDREWNNQATASNSREWKWNGMEWIGME